MGTNHVLPPADPVAAILAMAQQSDANLEHVRTCAACRWAWYRAGAFRAGCTDPRRGGIASQSIGADPLPPPAREHIERCLACRLLVLDAARAVTAHR
jgi:hypothetical protein